MQNEMTKFEMWFLKRVIRKQVIQSEHHDRRITNLYTMIVDAARKEFYEDNKPTLDDFLKELHQKALDT